MALGDRGRAAGQRAKVERVLSQWPLQDAKQRFSELIRSVRSNGPQFVTRHGRPVAVVLDFDEYRQLKGDAPDFKTFLRAAPHLESLDVERPRRHPHV